MMCSLSSVYIVRSAYMFGISLSSRLSHSIIVCSVLVSGSSIPPTYTIVPSITLSWLATVRISTFFSSDANGASVSLRFAFIHTFPKSATITFASVSSFMYSPITVSFFSTFPLIGERTVIACPTSIFSVFSWYSFVTERAWLYSSLAKLYSFCASSNSLLDATWLSYRSFVLLSARSACCILLFDCM